MKSLEMTGRTVDEAVEAALRELGVPRDQCQIEVLEEGSKGFLGLLGSKLARVRVTVLEPEEPEPLAAPEVPVSDPQVLGSDASERARLFLEGLLERMGVTAAVESRVDDDGTVFMNVTGKGLGVVIGRRGQTLDAVQYLVNIVANRDAPQWTRFIVDAEGYRERRAETLRQLAQRTADRAKARGRRVRLDPMTALERRIIHLELQGHPDVDTRSEGEEPYRRVVIIPKT